MTPPWLPAARRWFLRYQALLDARGAAGWAACVGALRR